MRCISALSVGCIGRLGQIGSFQTLCKILTLGTEIKKSTGETY